MSRTCGKFMSAMNSKNSPRLRLARAVLQAHTTSHAARRMGPFGGLPSFSRVVSRLR